MVDFDKDLEKKGGLSANHLKELEGVLSSLLTNQEIIIEQNRELLSAKKMGRIWAIIKFIIIWIALPVIFMQFLPQIMDSVLGQVSGIVNQQIERKAGDSLNIDPNRIKELKQLLR